MAFAATALTFGAVGASHAADSPALKSPMAAMQETGKLPQGLTTTFDATVNLGSRLLPGQSMTSTQYLSSPNGQHVLAADGAMRGGVGLYLAGPMASPLDNLAISFTNSTVAVSNVLVMQTDGNLVLYTNGMPTWSSNTYGNPGAWAAMQDDRNVVVYSAANRPLFATGTTSTYVSSINVPPISWNSYLKSGYYLFSPDGQYKLVMQGDGNLVQYRMSHGKTVPVWASGTNGNPGAFLVEQSDGNIVLYSSTLRPLWSTNTYGKQLGINTLQLQSDGNIVLYQYVVGRDLRAPAALWASGRH